MTFVGLQQGAGRSVPADKRHRDESGTPLAQLKKLKLRAQAEG